MALQRLLFSWLGSLILHGGVVVVLLGLKTHDRSSSERIKIELFFQHQPVASGSEKTQEIESQKQPQSQRQSHGAVKQDRVADKEAYANAKVLDRSSLIEAGYLRQRATEDALEFVGLNLEYPEEARRRGWQGRVVVRIVLTENGYVRETEVAESSGYRVLDRAAVHLLAQIQQLSYQVDEELRLLVPVDYILKR